MRVISIGVAIGLAGCLTTNVSKVGPFVRDIQAQPQTHSLTVDSCAIQVETTRNYAWWIIGHEHSTEREIVQGECWRQHVPAGDAP